MAALLALASAAVFGAADFTGGYASRRLPVLTVTLVTNVVGITLAAVLVAVFGGTWTTAAVIWGGLAGACGLGGLLLLYLGLAEGPNRLISPLSAVLAAVFPVTIGIATGDRPRPVAMAGLVLAPAAIWLVAGGDHRVGALQRRTLSLAVGAGVGFGLFFACLAQTPDDAGAVPLLAARAASTTVLVTTTLVMTAAGPSRPDRPQMSALALPALAGVLDMSANGLFLWSTRSGDLAVVGALVNLYPVTTVLLALAILHERMTRPQMAGLAVAVASAALLS